MTQQIQSPVSQHYQVNLRSALDAWPADGVNPVSVVAPGVADVMHGIGEDTDALLLTATLGLSFAVSVWPTAGDDLRVRFLPESGQGAEHEFSTPIKSLAGPPARLVEDCAKAERAWATPISLVISRAVAEGLLSKPRQGLAVLVQTDFPPDADWGRRTVLAAATLSALCRLHGVTSDVLNKARLCSEAVATWTGLRSLRTALTSLIGPADGSLLQIQLYPRLAYESLPLPPGIMIQPIRTRLSREVKLERLVETRLCVEMAQQVLDAMPASGGSPARRLAAITPS